MSYAPIKRPLIALSLLLPALMATACTPAANRTVARADPQVTAACRTRADDVYARQNRADLSRRDQRDSPFSSSGNTGITSAGLGERYARDRMVASCVAANSGGSTSDASTGPTFTGPTAE